MFRRKDELDMDATEENPQGSLLSGNSDTVSVLSPQQAAQYSSSQSPANQTSPAGTNSSNAAPATSQFGQVSRPATAEASRPTAPSAASSSFRSPSSSPAQPVSEAPRRPASEARPSSFAAPSSFANPSKDGRRILTVGSEILLKGEITACDRLVIEGKVDATVKEVHTIELAESGSFKGHAEVEYAEISGKFEGELIVKQALVIHGTGTISGKITYGEIEIQRGGELSGEVQTIGMKSSASNARSKNKEAA